MSDERNHYQRLSDAMVGIALERDDLRAAVLAAVPIIERYVNFVGSDDAIDEKAQMIAWREALKRVQQQPTFDRPASDEFKHGRFLLQVDGDTMRVQGFENMNDESKSALADLVKTARKQIAKAKV